MISVNVTTPEGGITVGMISTVEEFRDALKHIQKKGEEELNKQEDK